MFRTLLANLHYYVVAASVDAATFAIYAVGCFQIPFVDLVVTPTGNVMMVRMREAVTAGRPDAVLATWHDTTYKLALFFLPIIGILVVTARELIPFLFTVRYSASIPIFMVWAVAHLPVVLATEGVLRAHGGAAKAADGPLHPETRRFIEAAQIEGEIRDAATNQLLAAGVDRRRRQGAMPVDTWAEVARAMDFWADRVCSRLEARTGKRQAP